MRGCLCLKKKHSFTEPRKRKSRWNAENQKAFVPGMPTMLPSDLSEEQLKQYLCKLNFVCVLPPSVGKSVVAFGVLVSVNKEEMCPTTSASAPPLHQGGG